MSTVFYNDAVKVDINKGDEPITSLGADIRNTLLVTTHNRFTEAFRKYTNKNELLLDGFTIEDFAYKFASVYFDSAVDVYDRPSLYITGGVILPNPQDYIVKIQKAIGKTNNFGLIATDIVHRKELTPELEADFILEMATYVETTEKFYAVWLDEKYIPQTLTWIWTNQNEVVLTDTPYGLVTESTKEEF